jgi:hypothetical protein
MWAPIPLGRVPFRDELSDEKLRHYGERRSAGTELVSSSFRRFNAGLSMVIERRREFEYIFQPAGREVAPGSPRRYSSHLQGFQELAGSQVRADGAVP